MFSTNRLFLLLVSMTCTAPGVQWTRSWLYADGYGSSFHQNGSEQYTSTNYSGIVDAPGIGSSRSGWVDGQVSLLPRQTHKSGYSSSLGSRTQARMVGDASPAAAEAAAGGSILEKPSSALNVSTLGGQSSLGDGQVSSSLQSRGLPSSALMAPANANNSASFPASPSQIMLSPVESGVNPLAGIAATAQLPAGSVQAEAGSTNIFGLRRGRMGEWVRSFPLFQLNQSTTTSETASGVWEEQVQSFFRAPEQNFQQRQGLFSGWWPSQNSLSNQNQAASPYSGSQSSNSSSAPSANGLTSQVNPPEAADAGNTNATGVQGNPVFNPTSRFRGASGWFGLRPAADTAYQAYRADGQQGSNPAQGNASAFGASQPSQANQQTPYSAFQAPKQGCWNQFWGRWFGTGYRTSSYRVPITYYRPVLTTDPNTGAQVLVQQPCTSFVQQEQRSPIRLFRSARPNLSGDPAYGLPADSCPPAYTAAMPSLIYPGLGYVVAANPTTGLQNSSYVIAVNGMQQVTLPVAVTVWNGAVIPASATVVKPSQLQAQSYIQGSVGSEITGSGPATAAVPSNTWNNGSSPQSFNAVKPLTAADLGVAGDRSPASDLTPMPKPRLESFRYAPAESSTVNGQDSQTDVRNSDGDLSILGSGQSLFSAPSHVRSQPAQLPANRGVGGEWRLQNAADSTAMLPPPAERRKIGQQLGGGEIQSDDSQGDTFRSNSPSLEDLLRSENFVSAEPILAPRGFQPSYPRRSESRVRSMTQSSLLGDDHSKAARATATGEFSRSLGTAGMTTISTSLPMDRISEVKKVDESKWIRQPTSAR